MTTPGTHEDHQHDWSTAADGLKGLHIDVCAFPGCPRVRIHIEATIGYFKTKDVFVELDGETHG